MSPRDADSRPTQRAFRPRRRVPHAARIGETLRALDLIEADDSWLSPLAARALGLAVPDEVTPRERRLIELAYELSQTPRACFAFRDHARSYLALAACSWARDRSAPARNAALIGAIAIAAPCSANIRRAMGVDARLDELARDATLDASVRAQASRLAREERLHELDLHRAMQPALLAAEAQLLENMKHLG